MSEKIEELGVLVLMLTYNHARFIQKAVESVLNQETEFPVELYISDDSSQDNTAEIIGKLSSRGNVKLFYYRQEVNLGPMKNGDFLRNLAKNHQYKYVALLEGDDCWTDIYKLQRQVDFLENNHDYTGCCHNLRVIDDNNKDLGYSFIADTFERDFFLEDLIKSGIGCPIGTASVLFRRNILFSQLDEDFSRLAFGDRPMFILLLKYGPIRFYPECWALYRKHVGGYTAIFNWERFFYDYSSFFEYTVKKLDVSYHEIIRQEKMKVYFIAFAQLYNNGNDLFKEVFKRIIAESKTREFLTFSFLKILFKRVIYF
ncbi:MAG: glycosyltransferase [Chitinophagaceae bacterium]|nr:glycosyltransferase [Chitinophagaceae bacterium]